LQRALKYHGSSESAEFKVLQDVAEAVLVPMKVPSPISGLGALILMNQCGRRLYDNPVSKEPRSPTQVDVLAVQEIALIKAFQFLE
jgi:hypothetical protein